MVTRILDAATAAEFRGAMAQLQTDVHEHLHTDTWACWETDRPAGWSDGTAVEGTDVIATGTGKLTANGAGGPQTGEMVIHVESPYRLRCLASAPIESGHLLVVNGHRLFRVDIPKRESEGDLLMDVYLTELIDTPLPGVTP